jgi:hypothetical protein
VLEEKGVKQTKFAQQLGKSYNMVNGYAVNTIQEVAPEPFQPLKAAYIQKAKSLGIPESIVF